MKNTPPSELDFLTLFETEPALADANEPWICNTATYETERDGCLVRFSISPAYSALKVSLAIGGREVAEADLAAFTELEIVTDGDKETLIARFGASNASALFLTLRPTVRLVVGVSSDA